jgi:hypothetical protein
MTDIKIQMWSFPSLALWWAGAYSGQRNVNVQDSKDFDIFSEPWIWFKTSALSLSIALRFEVWILDFLEPFFGQLLDESSALLGHFFGHLHNDLDIFVPLPLPLEMRHAKAF